MPVRQPLTPSLAELVSAAGARDPEGIAVVDGMSQLGYGQLDRAVAGLAADLVDRGLVPGDRVAVLAGTGLAFPVAAHAVLRAGGVVVPISPSTPTTEMAALFRAARVEIVLCDVEHEDAAWAGARAYDPHCGAVSVDLDAARSRRDRVAIQSFYRDPAPAPAEWVQPGTPAVILFTSGSTGRSKGVVHSHEGLLHNAYAVAHEMLRLGPGDVMLGMLPLAHSYGLSAVLNACLVAGARLELLPRFDAARAWRLIVSRGITVLTGVPTMYRRLAGHRDATRNTDLRLAVVSGSACPPAVAREVRLRLGVPLIERYGMTEASPLTWHLLREDSEPGSLGRPGWGVHIRATSSDGRVLPSGSTGELEVRAPSMLLRYLDRRDNLDGFHDGWIRTGDLGQVSADGALRLSGRIKDVILRGGYTVAAAEVERAIESHPAVAEAAVVGVLDADMGEEICAAVVLHRGKRVSSEDDLAFHVRDRLATWKVPRRWRLVAELPHTPLGKVQKTEVRELFAVTLEGGEV
jgi:long-chain acyl-CoA synthetase